MPVLQAVLPSMYEQRLCPEAKLPGNSGIAPTRVYLMDSDIATDLLQMMLKGSNLVDQIQAMAAEEAAGAEGEAEGEDSSGMSAAEARTMGAAAAYGHDSYQPGEAVLILADYLDGQLMEAPVAIAWGTIRGGAAVGTDECAFFEVRRWRCRRWLAVTAQHSPCRLRHTCCPLGPVFSISITTGWPNWPNLF